MSYIEFDNVEFPVVIKQIFRNIDSGIEEYYDDIIKLFNYCLYKFYDLDYTTLVYIIKGDKYTFLEFIILNRHNNEIKTNFKVNKSDFMKYIDLFYIYDHDDKKTITGMNCLNALIPFLYEYYSSEYYNNHKPFDICLDLHKIQNNKLLMNEIKLMNMVDI